MKATDTDRSGRSAALRRVALPRGERYLIVSLHDVHPGSWDGYRSFVNELAALGVGRVSLLVVPSWKRGARVDGSGELAAWLRSAAARGHEICLHGLFHGVEHVRGGVVAQLIGRFYTDREGEFYRLGYGEAVRWLRAGRALLARAGLEVTGFTPPAWLAGPEVLRALSDLEFVYTTTLGSVVLPGARLRLRAPTLVFSSRSRWRRVASRLWVPRWAALTARARVLRIAVHPGDLRSPEIRTCLDALIRVAAADRRSITYRDLVSRAASFLPRSPDLRAPGGVAPPRHSPTMSTSALLARNANLSTIVARNLPHGTLAAAIVSGTAPAAGRVPATASPWPGARDTMPERHPHGLSIHRAG